MEIDLSALEPLAATPHSPGNIAKVARDRRHAGGPGLRRELHELLVQRPDDRREDARRQAAAPERQPRRRARVAAGDGDDRGERRAGGAGRGRRAHQRMRVRVLHRHRPGAEEQCRQPPDQQPEFPRAERHAVGERLPRQPASRRRRGASPASSPTRATSARRRRRSGCRRNFTWTTR